MDVFVSLRAYNMDPTANATGVDSERLAHESEGMNLVKACWRPGFPGIPSGCAKKSRRRSAAGGDIRI